MAAALNNKLFGILKSYQMSTVLTWYETMHNPYPNGMGWQNGTSRLRPANRILPAAANLRVGDC